MPGAEGSSCIAASHLGGRAGRSPCRNPRGQDLTLGQVGAIYSVHLTCRWRGNLCARKSLALLTGKGGHLPRSGRLVVTCGDNMRWADRVGRPVHVIGESANWHARVAPSPSVAFSYCSAALALVLLAFAHVRKMLKAGRKGLRFRYWIRQASPMGLVSGGRRTLRTCRSRQVNISWHEPERHFHGDGAMKIPHGLPGVSYSSIGPAFPGSSSRASKAFEHSMHSMSFGEHLTSADDGNVEA